MEKIDRTLLPYRRNCEAYLRYKHEYVVARNIDRVYLEFPGGGIKKDETPEKAILREIQEETGAVVKQIRKIGIIRFDWHPHWAITKKQKRRYAHYRGEEMHLFEGEVKLFPKAYPTEWKGNKMISISRAIECVESQRPFPMEMCKYYQTQLNQLKKWNRKN